MINPALFQAPRHARLIGEMVIGYSELEIGFAHAAGLALGLKHEVLAATLGIYSETGKIRLIDKLARRAFEGEGMLDPFRTAKNMLLNCATIRNTYAHCQFRIVSGRHKLEYATTDDLTKHGWPVSLEEIPWRPAPLRLLREQEAYFEGTRSWILYLELNLQQRGRRHQIDYRIPPTLPLPRYSTPNRKAKS